MTNEKKLFCANNLLAQVVDSLKILYPNKSIDYLRDSFMSSNICKKLYELDNGLWGEGPDYIISLYLEEKQKLKN